MPSPPHTVCATSEASFVSGKDAHAAPPQAYPNGYVEDGAHGGRGLGRKAAAGGEIW